MFEKLKLFEHRSQSQKSRHPVVQIDILTGEVIAQFESIREAVRKTNVPKSSIQAHLINSKKYAGGFLWRRMM
jgi:hypothetical protein